MNNITYLFAPFASAPKNLPSTNIIIPIIHSLTYSFYSLVSILSFYPFPSL